MIEDTTGSCEPKGAVAPAMDNQARSHSHEGVSLTADGAVTVAVMEDLGDLVLTVAQRCEDKVAATAHRVACLRAARGGTSGSSQTAGTCLAHPRTKAVSLANEHRSILAHLADAQEELATLMVATIGKILEVDLYKADLVRCEAAQARKRREDEERKLSGLWPEARAIVATLARLGVREGHWSTLTRATEEKIAALILADNMAAGVGSPDDPRIAGPRSRRAR